MDPLAAAIEPLIPGLRRYARSWLRDRVMAEVGRKIAHPDFARVPPRRRDCAEGGGLPLHVELPCPALQGGGS